MSDRVPGPPSDGTILRKKSQYRDRWSSFGARTGISGLSEHLSPDELRQYEIFRDLDDQLLDKLSPDIAVAEWKKGTVLFEEGAYIDLAFYIVEGAVEVFLEHQQHEERPLPSLEPIFDLQRTGYLPTLPPDASGASRPPTAPRGSGSQPSSRPLSRSFVSVSGQGVGQSGVHGGTLRGTILKPAGDVMSGSGITFLSAMDFDLPTGQGRLLCPGDLLGEIGAMSGWPQAVTARTAADSTLIQIRLPALRTLKRRSQRLKERLDAIYRQTTLGEQLRASPLFAGCDDAFIAALKDEVELVSLDPGEVVTEEGTPAESLYLLRSGFLKLKQGFGEGELAVDYLSKGMTLGEVEILLGDTGGWTVSAESVEYAELVEVPAAALNRLVAEHPEVGKRLWQSATARVRAAGAARRDMARSEFIDVSLAEGWVQANALFVIDLDVCTRCDDCVRACADTHGGLPRFVREGEKYANLQIATACYHCRDPVCLVGCPTGAIHRTGVGAIVAVDEAICIGCGTCARSCPYDAITMHDTGETWPGDMIPEMLRGKPRQVASKCDLCVGREGGPACVENCPNGCAYRVGGIDELEDLLRP